MLTAVVQIAIAPVALNLSQSYVKLLRPLHSMQFARAFVHINIEVISVTADYFYLYHQGLKFVHINMFIYISTYLLIIYLFIIIAI